jgi:drug/metabolite transporter (DMT)-like permease
MSTYFFLGTALVSLSLLGVLHKVADFKNCRPALINAFLFLWAGIFMLGLLLARPERRAHPGLDVVTTAVVCGFLASLAILAFQTGIRFGRIATSWLIINLSTAIPTLASIFIYQERVEWKRAVGLSLMTLSLFLLWKDKQQSDLPKGRGTRTSGPNT